LFIRSGVRPQPILHGGAHENDRRAGTENLASIVGFAAATARFLNPPVFSTANTELFRKQLRESLASLEPVVVLTPAEACLPNTVAFIVRGTDSTTILAALDLEGICASSGSACASGSLEPSHVAKAMGFDAAEARGLIRFSLGRDSSPAEVDAVVALLPGLVQRAQLG
jgi:cysteine desulfurase